ncbi:hypothetical protein EBT16_04810 [bacterium]|nr:hypothetical protein [bacterium]
MTVDGVFGGFWIEGGTASVSGQDGNDELFVLNFSQAKIYGGEGNDRLLADQVRNVSVEGGDGEDTIYLGYIYYRSGNSDGSNYKPKVHVLDGGADNDLLTAQGFSYSGHGQGFITMRGGEGDDILTLTDEAAGKQKWESSLRPYTSNEQYGVSAFP